MNKKRKFMPKCRNCGTRLTKFDIDICPVCGTKDPLKGVSSDTLEVTSEISLDADISFRVCYKKTMVIFFIGLGIFGAGFYYLKKIKVGLIWLLCHLVLMAGAFAGLYFLANLQLDLSIIIPIVVGYLFNAIFAGILCLNNNLKDGEGEYVR